MRTSCPRCGYALRSEVRKYGAFRFVVYLDGGEPVEHCPRCGYRLGGNALGRRDLDASSRDERTRRSAP
jgi:DNA-directed RNA polymerase subunit RPC12/RpoP